MKLRCDLAFVVNDFNFFNSHRKNLSLYLLNKGYRVTLITNTKGVLKEDLDFLIEKGLSIIDYRFNRGSLNIFSAIKEMYLLNKILRDINPKTAFFVSSKPIIFGGISSLIQKRNNIYFLISGLGYSFISNSFKARLSKLIITSLYKVVFKNNNSKVIFQNEDDRKHFINKRLVKLEKTLIIKGSGVDTNSFVRKSYPEKITFLFASRLLKDKGILEFLEAAKLIESDLADFIVAGDIDISNPNSLSPQELQDLKSNQRISFLGEVKFKDMKDLYQKAHVLVLPSYREGLPKVALEAGSSQMALLLTDVEGCRECLIPNKTGLLVKKGDFSDLYNKMRSLIAEEEKIYDMGVQSRQFVVENFSQNVIFPRFLKILQHSF